MVYLYSTIYLTTNLYGHVRENCVRERTLRRLRGREKASMKNRAADGEKRTGTKKRGQTFCGEGAELTFSVLDRRVFSRSALAQRISFERHLHGDILRNPSGCHFTITEDPVAGRARSINTSRFRRFTKHARHLGRPISECFQNIPFSKE